jgi:hypothetical protein
MPSTNDKPGFKPGANMPAGNYDPKQQGMQPSGNHASGVDANDVAPGTNESRGLNTNQQQRGQSEHELQQGNIRREDLRNEQNAATAAAEATSRDRSAGARGDNSSHANYDKK